MFINIRSRAVIVLLSIGLNTSYAAVDEILNDYYFQNPAELSTIHESQWILGNQYISPEFEFKGISSGQMGTAISNPHDSLPYTLASYRFSDRWVLGLNIVPSGYGHFEWPADSIVAYDSTKTFLLYYKAIIQSSYQVSNNLALGLGLNIEYNYRLQLNFLVPNQGQQSNWITGTNVFPDVGLFYKINAHHFLTAAFYAPLNTNGYGISYTNSMRNTNYSSNFRDAAVVFIGLQQKPNESWFFEEKVYWSGWSIQKGINFTNTTTGTYIRSADWKDIFSFQLNTRFATTEKVAILAGGLYDTKPINSATNQVGYPLAPTVSLSVGLDLALLSELSLQVNYLYSTFIPLARINAGNSNGTVSANIQGAVLQLTFKS